MEDPPWLGAVLVELKLDIFAVQEEGDGDLGATAGEISAEWLGFIELSEGGGDAGTFEDGIGIGLLGVGIAADESGGEQGGFEIH